MKKRECLINIQKLLLKAYNKPNSIKDNLYDNLNFIEKMQLIFNDKDQLLNKVFPNFVKGLNILNIIIFSMSSMFWFIFMMIIGYYNLILGLISFITFITLAICSMLYVGETMTRYYDRKSLLEKISYWIISILSFAFLIDFIIIFTLLIIFNGRSKIKNYVTNYYERDFHNKFNQIYYDDNYTAYLEHELITTNIHFNQNEIYYNSLRDDQKFYTIYQDNIETNRDQNERAILKYIKYHTNRELDFKQLLIKLSYLYHQSMLDHNESLMKQDEDDQKVLNMIMQNQKSEEELLKNQLNR